MCVIGHIDKAIECLIYCSQSLQLRISR